MKRLCVRLLALALLLVMCSVPATAEEIQLEYVGQVDGFYRYQFPSGVGFTCSSQMGMTDNMMVAFSFDTNVVWALYRDNQPIVYAAEDILETAGSYQLQLTDPKSGDTAQFSFGIIAYTMPSGMVDLQNGAGSLTFGDIVEQPPLLLGYDSEQGMLRYTLPNDVSFLSTVAQGGIISIPVRLTYSEGMTVTVWHNDQSVAYSSGETLAQEGTYRVQLVQMKPTPQSTDPNTYIVTFNFRLVGDVSSLDLVTVPEGFYIRQASCDGKPLLPTAHRYLPMTADGDYRIDLASDSPAISYTLAFHRDTVAPIIQFSGSGLSGMSDELVSYMVDDPDALVTVYLGGSAIEPTGWLGSEGNYRLTAQDKAGNTRSYLLRIDLVDYSLVVVLTVILTAVAVLMLVTYLVTRRYGLRVI